MKSALPRTPESSPATLPAPRLFIDDACVEGDAAEVAVFDPAG